MFVRAVMAEHPRFCYSGWTCRAAAAVMKEGHCGFLPVLESGSDARTVGVVTDRDLCTFVVADGRDPSSVWVHQCMRHHPITAAPDDDLEVVLARMVRAHVHRVPVVDQKGKLLGVLSLSDLVRTRAITPEHALNAIAELSTITPFAVGGASPGD